MSHNNIPVEWDLGADRRYKRQNMERAMRGKIERGLVELITNSDDSYRDLEEKGRKAVGKIRIEIERRRRKTSNTKVIVRDRASGMDKKEMYNKLGELGRRTSGFEKGKKRRGLHGRGAKDIAAFGTVHFESIKDGIYNYLIIPPSLKCHFKEPREKKATDELRDKLGIPRGNGTVVTVEVEPRFSVTQHDTLVKYFFCYYSLRDIFSDPKRDVKIIDLNNNREDPLIYRYPEGEVVFDMELNIPDYPEAKAKLLIRKHETPFEQENLPYREGILVKSSASIHDCSHFGLEKEPLSFRFTGILYCPFIDNLILEYDDREEKNPDKPNHPSDNPIRLLDPFRDGLILEHPFARKLYAQCREKLGYFIEELKAAEKTTKRRVADESLKKKLDGLSKEISRVFEKKVIELNEEIITQDLDDPKIDKLAMGLHIIPPEDQPIILNQPKTFSVLVKHYEPLETSLPINITSSDPENVKIRENSVFFKKISENQKVGRTTFTIEGLKVGSEAFIEARYSGYDNLVLVRIISPPAFPQLYEGFSFEKPIYHLRINKEKPLLLRLINFSRHDSQISVHITSDHPEVVIKSGATCKLRSKKDLPGVFEGHVRVLGRQLKVNATITAYIDGFEPASTLLMIEEKERPKSGVLFKFDPVEENFGALRYKWDEKIPYLLLIGAKHPSIRRYLGEPDKQKYPGINNPLYHTVLAEVIAEALAFNILERQFRREGDKGMLDYASTDAYYHKNFSEFLDIAHNKLVTAPIFEQA